MAHQGAQVVEERLRFSALLAAASPFSDELIGRHAVPDPLALAG